MKITLDTEKLREKDGAMTLYLLSLLSSCPITRETFEEARNKFFIRFEQPYKREETFPSYVTLTETGTFVVESNIAAHAEMSEERIYNLAKKLQEIFPSGKKPGYAYTWRDSTSCIVDRLKKFFVKYGNYPDDRIIKVTQEYVDSFNGNYTYMQLLKYFIWKNKVTGEQIVRGRIVGEVERQSQLAAYLEDTDDKRVSQDWEARLC